MEAWVEPHYPIVVTYPFVGEHFLMLWKTHREQHKLALARTLPSLRRTAQLIFADYPEATIANVQCVDIIGAPPHLDAMHQAHRERQSRARMASDMRAYLVMKYGHDECPRETLPDGVSRCPYVEDDGDPPCDGCARCVGGFRIAGHDFESFYRSRYDRWIADNADPYVDNTRHFRVAYTDHGRSWAKTFAAVANFGHHCGGVILLETSSFSKRHWPDVLFFYRRPEEFQDDVIRGFADEARRATEEKEAAKKAERDAEFDEQSRRQDAERDAWLAKMLA